MRHPVRRALLLVPVLFLVLSTTASAHALLERSNPTPDAVLSSPPRIVHLWFSEDLNVAASAIIVWDRHRHDQTTGRAVLVPGTTRQLKVGLHRLVPGSYLVLWTSVSADDGHILHGSFVFSVGHRGPLPSLAGVNTGSTAQTFPDTPTLAALLAHWIELAAAVIWTGTAACAIFLLSKEDAGAGDWAAERPRRLLLVRSSLLALFLASLILILLQAYGLAGNNWNGLTTRSVWSSVFAVEYGRLWLVRQALVLLALVASLAPAAAQHRRPRLPVQVLLGALYLYLLAGSGHGASAAIGAIGGGHLISASVAFDWVHLIADALWFGGQIYIALVLLPVFLRTETSGRLGVFLNALQRFSPAAYLSIGLYVVTGIFAAKIHIPSLYAFYASVYGRTLIVKIVLIGLMMLVSTLTVFILRPRIRRQLGSDDRSPRLEAMIEGLRFWLRVNPVLGMAVLLATSVLFYYPVPFGFVPPPPPAYVVHGGPYTATVAIHPGGAGVNQITVNLRDVHGPVKQAGIRILTTMLDMVMGQGVAVMRQTGPGRFTGSTDFGMGGHWQLLLLVYTPSGNFQRIPLRVTISA